MNTRLPSLRALLLLLPLAPSPLGATGGSPDAPVRAPQNVLIIVGDDMGIDRVGAYGYTRANGTQLAPKTSNLDRLASRGILFRNAWAHPYCSPSRAAGLTGRYPNRTGIGYVVQGPFGDSGMRADEITLPNILPATYLSAVIGKWHLADNSPIGALTGGLDHGPRTGFRLHYGSSGNFIAPQHYFGWTQIRSRAANPAASREVFVTQYATTRTTVDALRAIEAFEEKPWLVWVAYNAPHNPLHVPPAYLQQSEPPNPGNPLQMGKSMIEALDSEIGRLLEGISAPILARTTVIFFGDNGTSTDVIEPPFPPQRAKGTVYNGGVHVPFIVVSPATPVALRGSECDALIDLTDIMPTLADITNVPHPAGLDGVSLMPYLLDPSAASQRPWIYAERFERNFVPAPGTTIGSQSLTSHYQTVRDDRFKLIRRMDDPTGTFPTVTEEFYDIESDYFETIDLLDATGNPPAALQDVYSALSAVLDDQAS